MPPTATPSPIAAYIAAQPPASRATLEAVRAAIRKALPATEEIISYKIAAFRLPTGVVLYFAGWKRHYSIYPANAALVAAFKAELAPYEVNNKGTIRFPLDAPVPSRLIGRIAKFRAAEDAARVSAKSVAATTKAKPRTSKPPARKTSKKAKPSRRTK